MCGCGVSREDDRSQERGCSVVSVVVRGKSQRKRLAAVVGFFFSVGLGSICGRWVTLVTAAAAATAVACHDCWFLLPAGNGAKKMRQLMQRSTDRETREEGGQAEAENNKEPEAASIILSPCGLESFGCVVGIDEAGAMEAGDAAVEAVEAVAEASAVKRDGM